MTEFQLDPFTRKSCHAIAKNPQTDNPTLSVGHVHVQQQVVRYCPVVCKSLRRKGETP